MVYNNYLQWFMFLNLLNFCTIKFFQQILLCHNIYITKLTYETSYFIARYNIRYNACELCKNV